MSRSINKIADGGYCVPKTGFFLDKLICPRMPRFFCINRIKVTGYHQYLDRGAREGLLHLDPDVILDVVPEIGRLQLDPDAVRDDW